MKTISSLLCFLLILSVMNSSCRKDDDMSAPSNSEKLPEVDIAVNGIPVDMIDNGEYVVLLLNDMGTARIVKMHYNGEIFGEWSYPGVRGIPQRLLQAGNDEYIFAEVESKGHLDTTHSQELIAYFQNGFKCEGNDQTATYELKVHKLGIIYKKTTQTFVVRTSTTGNIKWHISMPHELSGRSMVLTPQSLHLATVRLPDARSSYTIDNRFGGNYPVITYDYFSGEMYDFQLNPATGSIMKQQAVVKEKIKDLNILSHDGGNFYYHQLIATENFSVFAHDKGFIRLDEVAPFVFSGPYRSCIGNIGHHRIESICQAGEEGLYMKGIYTDTTDFGRSYHYLAKLDLQGNAKWITHLDRASESLLFSIPQEAGFYFVDRHTTVEKYDKEGRPVWKEHLVSTNGSLTNTMAVSPKGMSFISRKGNGYVLIRVITAEG